MAAKKRADGRLQKSITLPNGKRKVFYGKSQAELNRKIAAYRYEEEKGSAFDKVIDAWWDEKEQHIVPSTARGYIASRDRAKKQFEGRYIKDITPSECSAFLKALAASGLGKKVCHTQLNILSMVFDYAVLRGYIQFNPCASVKIPSGLSAQKRELPSEKDLKIVESSDWLFPFFLLYTGLRRGEALAITYEDIDREKKVIHVTKAVGYANNKPYIKSTKTESGVRDVILLDKLAERIPKGHGLLFPAQDGQLYHESHIRRDWLAWAEKAGTNVTPHQLRHGYATILHDAGIDVKDAQYLLGHSTVAMTQDVYTHIRQSRLNDASKKLSDFVSVVKK